MVEGNANRYISPRCSFDFRNAMPDLPLCSRLRFRLPLRLKIYLLGEHAVRRAAMGIAALLDREGSLEE
jgi:hypothetical protein